MDNLASIEEITEKIIGAGAVEVRDVDGGQDPFVYSTGNRGPGYVMVKGLVGQPNVLKFLTRQLAHRVVDEATFDFIEGNATGGMVPGWQLRNDVSDLLGREVPFTYLRGSRKEGGHGELITGNRNNPLIVPGMSVLVVEELVNYAGTTGNAADIYRIEGYPVSHAACILSYDHEVSNQRLTEKNISLVSLVRLPELLDVGVSLNLIDPLVAASYHSFLADPVDWQLSRGLAIPKDSAQNAIQRGYSLVELSESNAIAAGAPLEKVNSGVVYFQKD